MTYNIHIVKTDTEFTNLEKIWNELLTFSPANNYFLSWEWLWHWWQVFAEPDDRLMILLVEKEKEIIGIAPFYVRKRFLGGIYPVRRMMFLGTQEEGDGDVCSDYMDVIYREDEERGVVNILFQAIVQHDICDEIYLSKIDTSTKTFTLFQEEARNLKFFTRIADEFVSPYIKLPSTWDEYLKSISKSMRWNIKNERRKLQKCSNVIYRRTENPTDMGRDFDDLVTLHQKRWGRQGIAGAFSNEKFTMFHKNVMQYMIKNGNLELVVLSEDNQNRAVVYNIYYKNKIYVYQTGRDVDDRKIAFGYLLHCQCIENAIRKGLVEYDFLPKGPSDDYKDRFAKDYRVLSDLYMARTWFVKQFVKARESARSVYHYVKPAISRAHQSRMKSEHHNDTAVP